MASTIRIGVDDELKAKSDKLFKELGTDTTIAIRMFLTQAVAYNGFPFEIKKNSVNKNSYVVMSEDEIMNRLEVSRRQAAEGKVRIADAVIKDLRGKYELQDYENKIK